MIIETLRDYVEQKIDYLNLQLLNQQAKTKLDESSELIEEAVNEALVIDFNPSVYKNILIKIRNQQFIKQGIDSPFFKGIILEFKRGFVEIDNLFSSSNEKVLTPRYVASIYEYFKHRIDPKKLMYLNNGEEDSYSFVSESANAQEADEVLIQHKTTFVHELFAFSCSEDSIAFYLNAIIRCSNKFFTPSDKNSFYYINRLFFEYIDLTNSDGISIKEIIYKKSKQDKKYAKLAQKVEYFECYFAPIPDINQISGSDSHSEPIHMGVDESLIKLSVKYFVSFAKQVEKNKISISRDTNFNIIIDNSLTAFSNKLKEIIANENNLVDYISPVLARGDSEELEKNRFKFYAQVVLKLIDDIKNGKRFGLQYVIDSNEINEVGLNLKEIIALTYIALLDENSWHNPQEKTRHFMQYLTSLYSARRGYNIDFYGEFEFHFYPLIEDLNRCLGGMVNDIIYGLKDHKDVEVRIINEASLAYPVLLRLKKIISFLSEENEELINKWMIQKILSEEFLNIIKSELLKDEELVAEFGIRAIQRYTDKILRNLNSKQIREIGEKLKEIDFHQDVDGLFYSFIFDKNKGYILFLESLFNKDANKFNHALETKINKVFRRTNFAIQEVMELLFILELLYNKNNREISANIEKLLSGYEEKIHMENHILVIFNAVCLASESFFELLVRNSGPSDFLSLVAGTNSPFIKAYELKRYGIAMIMLDKFEGDDFLEIDDYKNTILQNVIIYGDENLVEYLLKKMNIEDLEHDDYVWFGFVGNKFALHTAVNYGKLEVVKLLLTELRLEGLNVIDINRKTALELALEKNYLEIAQLIDQRIKELKDSLPRLTYVNIEQQAFIPFISAQPSILNGKDQECINSVSLQNEKISFASKNFNSIEHNDQQSTLARFYEIKEILYSIKSIDYLMKEVLELSFGVPSWAMDLNFRIFAFTTVSYAASILVKGFEGVFSLLPFKHSLSFAMNGILNEMIMPSLIVNSRIDSLSSFAYSCGPKIISSIGSNYALAYLTGGAVYNLDEAFKFASISAVQCYSSRINREENYLSNITKVNIKYIDTAIAFQFSSNIIKDIADGETPKVIDVLSMISKVVLADITIKTLLSSFAQQSNLIGEQANSFNEYYGNYSHN